MSKKNKCNKRNIHKNLCSVSVLIAILCAVIFFTSCASFSRDRELGYVKELCSNQPMVGYLEGAKAEIQVQRENLESLKLGVNKEKYRQLEQELQNYSTEWESLNHSTQLACKDWAICQYRFRSSTDACKEARDKMEQRQEAARNFLERIKKLEISLPPPPVAKFPFELQIQNAKDRIKYLSKEYLKADTLSLVEVTGPYGDNVLDSPQLYDWNKVIRELEKQGYIEILKKTENNIEFKVTELLRRPGIDNTHILNAPFDVPLYFYPSGWMGDMRNIQLNTAFRDASRINDEDGLCIKINYQPGPTGWAGIIWQYPDGNWGDNPGSRIVGATRIIFWAKGDKGGEAVEFKAGGIRESRKRYKDSFEISIGRVILTNEWRRYEIPLVGQDLSSVIGAFAWIATRDANRNGLTFYMDGIHYE